MDTSDVYEIVFSEKCSNLERRYIKSTEQTNMVILEGGEPMSRRHKFINIFLPEGYPQSVSEDYTRYQTWDTAQAFCSSIMGILATQEMLRGMGVGDTNATPLAATIVWILKDGCGHIGKILFAFSHGTQLDAYSKKWRIYADILNDVAMCIEMALPYFAHFTTIVLCMSTTLKAIVGVAGGATRAALTLHHAKRGNLADVAAKDSAQETAVNLAASCVGVLLLSIFDSMVNNMLFLLMMCLHVVFNVLAVGAICLNTLNEPRYLQVIEEFIQHEVVPDPSHVNRREPILTDGSKLAYKMTGFKIKLGCSLKDASLHLSFENLCKIKKTFENEKYVLIPNIAAREMYVALKEGATSVDTLRAYFNAVILSIIISRILIVPQDECGITQTKYSLKAVCQILPTIKGMGHSGNENSVGKEYELFMKPLEIVMTTIRREWPRLQAELTIKNWSLDKHLLLVGEWRLLKAPALDDSLSTPPLNPLPPPRYINHPPANLELVKKRLFSLGGGTL